MELIYFCPAVNKPVGGIKVIYRQAEIVQEILRQNGVSVSIMHPNTWFFKIKWFESKVPIRRGFFKWQWSDSKPSCSRISDIFDSNNHMIILPELWARKYGHQLADMGVPYAIFVQNGYYISKGDPNILNKAYYSARCIMTISEDATQCVAMAFPGCESKILRVRCAVDGTKFLNDELKENIITYMPRKLADHSSKVNFFLRNHLPAHWKIIPIQGLSEDGVAKLLKRSKIFMSFSHFEGLGLPPIEAALAGNQVIGYTGQGGKEYWMPEIFSEVNSGDVMGFAKQVLSKVSELDKLEEFPFHTEVIKKLSEIYSFEHQIMDMKRFIELMFIN